MRRMGRCPPAAPGESEEETSVAPRPPGADSCATSRRFKDARRGGVGGVGRTLGRPLRGWPEDCQPTRVHFMGELALRLVMGCGGVGWRGGRGMARVIRSKHEPCLVLVGIR